MNSLATAPDPAAGRPATRRSGTSTPPVEDEPPGQAGRGAAGRGAAERTGAGPGYIPAPVTGPAADLPTAGPVAAPPPRQVRDMTTGELGRAGEELAASHLSACGWQIVERNLRLRHGELDIVALAHTTLVFVEVKTRRSFVTGVPQAAVTPDKLRRLRRLVGEYLMERSTPHRDVRIDVVAVHAHLDGTFSIEHLEAVS